MAGILWNSETGVQHMQRAIVSESIKCALDVLAIQSIRFGVFRYDVVWCPESTCIFEFEICPLFAVAHCLSQSLNQEEISGQITGSGFRVQDCFFDREKHLSTYQQPNDSGFVN